MKFLYYYNIAILLVHIAALLLFFFIPIEDITYIFNSERVYTIRTILILPVVFFWVKLLIHSWKNNRDKSFDILYLLFFNGIYTIFYYREHFLNSKLLVTIQSSIDYRLQKNTKRNLIMTLTYLSSKEEQVKYNKTVPYVHIPEELIEQWLSGFLPEQEWFREIFTKEEFVTLSMFNEEFLKAQKFLEKEDYPNVPEIFEFEVWNNLMAKAQETIDKLDNGVYL